MAESFNPDQYLAEKTGQSRSPEPFNPDAYLAQKTGVKEEPGLLSQVGDKALEYAVKAGRFVDRYTGAPVRSGIGAAQEGENPISAAFHQFGDDPSLAPTGKDIVKKAGITDDTTKLSDKLPFLYSDKEGTSYKEDSPFKLRKGGILDPTAAGAAGLGVDIASDPLNFIPLGAAAKAAGKVGLEAGGMAAKGLLKGSGKVVDIATGTGAGTRAVELGENVARGARDAGKGLLKQYFNPKLADDFSEMADIAKRNGIDPSKLPEAVEFGEDSLITRKARTQTEGVTGEARLKKHRESFNEVSNAMDNRISQIAGGGATDSVNAGKAIREGYAKAADDMFKQNDITYSTIQKMAPGIQLTEEATGGLNSKLLGIERKAKGIIERGVGGDVSEAQAKDLLKKVTAIRNGNGSIKQVVEQMQDIGKQAFPKKGVNTLAAIPPDRKALQELYGVMSDAVVDSTRSQLGDHLANSLVSNNERMADFFKRQAPIVDAIGSKDIADEKLFDQLVMRGDTNKLNSLKSVLPPEKIQQLKGAFLENLVRTNKNDEVLFGSLRNKMQSRQFRTGIQTLFDPNELREVSDLIRLGERYGDPFMSSSRTSQGIALRDIPKSLSTAVINDQMLDDMIRRARSAGAEEGLLRSEGGGSGLLGAAEKAKSEGFDALSKTQQQTLLDAIKERTMSPIKSRGPWAKFGKTVQSISPSGTGLIRDNEK